jgi:hypothetical protein
MFIIAYLNNSSFKADVEEFLNNILQMLKLAQL